MKRLKVLTALAMGIMASASGVVQVKAATYIFFEDFATKEVADYTAFKQTFNDDTTNLSINTYFTFEGYYRFDSCPTNFTLNVTYTLRYRINASGASTSISNTLPDFLCSTTNTFFSSTIITTLGSTILDTMVNDDVNFIEFNPTMVFATRAASQNRTLYLTDYEYFFDIRYDFGTTYLFNYFLSDTKYERRVVDGANSANWTFNAIRTVNVQYVYTTAGNDLYFILNSNTSDISNNRKKYAVDSNKEFFRGSSVGAGFSIEMLGTDQVVMTSASDANLYHTIRYYYLNVANEAQAIVDVPTFNFEEEDCGSFLALNVGCFINNAFAYITNDAPIVSDAFTLLNAGIEMAAQTFGIIGEFADDNVFGVLILAGFGFIAVKWFLKND
jgi:hypothetical protein